MSAGRFRISRAIVLAAALVFATLLAFAPVVRNEFINFDDDVYLTKNAHLQQGLTIESLRWVFTSVEGTSW